MGYWLRVVDLLSPAHTFTRQNIILTNDLLITVTCAIFLVACVAPCSNDLVENVLDRGDGGSEPRR